MTYLYWKKIASWITVNNETNPLGDKSLFYYNVRIILTIISAILQLDILVKNTLINSSFKALWSTEYFYINLYNNDTGKS